jgi:5-(aminomethyl)-3-furanmethanol phosphate kinase
MEHLIKGSSMWVIKIGGSLLGSPELERWLEIFVKFSDGNIIIVPGGGIFADAVRDAQKLTKVSDACAHKLAVMAMDQFGLVLANINPLLATAKTECEIDERTWQHRAIVWLPSHMVLQDDTIPQSWDVTSDSLAAWLATKLKAKQLILVKSEKPNDSKLCLKRMTEDCVVDLAFSEFTLNANFGSWMLRKDDFEHFLEGVDANVLAKIASSMH